MTERRIAPIVLLLFGCAAGDMGHGSPLSAGVGSSLGSSETSAADQSGSSVGDATSSSSAESSSSGDPWVPDPNGPAFLHADVWSTFWNDRTRCGAEYTFLEICQHRGEPDCSQYEAAVGACDPWMIVYGQVGPEQQGNELCSRGNFPDIGGCDATMYDFEALRFWWYGAEWQGNWPFATIKIFPQGADWTGGGELLAFSNLPGHAQAAMDGIDNHGLRYGCTMAGATSGDEAYQRAFGGFAWIEVPTDQPVTVVSASGTNFADEAFMGCSRGAATQDPWITEAPASVYGCIYTTDIEFEPGHHYYLQYGRIEELASPMPPPALVEAFTDRDITTEAACAL